jgi:hypothetical protein
VTSQSFEVIRDTLDNHGSKITNNRQGSFMAQCPHHEDSNGSLSVADKGDRVLIWCHAGCATEDVMRDLGLELGALFDGEPSRDKALPIRSYLYEDGYGRPWFWKDRYWPKTFICRLPGTDPGDRTGLKNRSPVLYHLPALLRGIAAKQIVWLVDGEKDVETAERHGLVATTTPHGAGSRWHPEYTRALSKAVEVIIVVDQDKAKKDGTLGTGQQHAVDAAHAMRSVGVKVRRVAPKVGKDLTDHFDAGFNVSEFIPDLTSSVRPRGITGDQLHTKTFKPLVYCIEDVLPAGLAILAGTPKSGKSWIALDMGLAVACGGKVMSSLDCTQGSVLYLAREDGQRRVQSRLSVLLSGAEAPGMKHMEIVPSDEPWTGGEIGLAAMTEWAEEVGDPRLVVVDTLAKVEPMMDDRDRYRSDYALMSAYKAWADRYDCTVLMIHHLRKSATFGKDADNGDPFDEISGTRGLTGAADTLMVLKTKRGTRDGTLHLTGRDVSEQSLELRKFGPLWTCVDVPEQV